MQAFESRPTRAASGRLRAASGWCPDGSGRRPDGSGRLRAVSDGSGRLLVGPDADADLVFRGRKNSGERECRDQIRLNV